MLIGLSWDSYLKIDMHKCDMKGLTLHTALYPVDELVGLAAVQQSSDGWQRVQDNGLRVGINVVLKHRDANVLMCFF